MFFSILKTFYPLRHIQDVAHVIGGWQFVLTHSDRHIINALSSAAFPLLPQLSTFLLCLNLPLLFSLLPCLPLCLTSHLAHLLFSMLLKLFTNPCTESQKFRLTLLGALGSSILSFISFPPLLFTCYSLSHACACVCLSALLCLSVCLCEN